MRLVKYLEEKMLQFYYRAHQKKSVEISQRVGNKIKFQEKKRGYPVAVVPKCILMPSRSEEGGSEEKERFNFVEEHF